MSNNIECLLDLRLMIKTGMGVLSGAGPLRETTNLRLERERR